MEASEDIDRGERRTADPRKLERFFGRPVPAMELEIWASIPPAHRDKVLQRMAALDRYHGADGVISAGQAAAEAGVKLGRFYQISRAWAEQRSLSSVGTFASRTRTRQRIVSEDAQALQAAVGGVVAAHPGASVAALARHLADVSGVKKAPNTLRQFVERELRRRRQKDLVGEEVQFDCIATSLRRADGSHHVAFLVIDGGTGLVLGHAVGFVSDSVAGYARAAANARANILGGSLSAGIWADATGRSQMVPGTDAEQVAALAARVRNELVGVAPQLVRAGGYGRYVRLQLGQKIGPVRLLPKQTEGRPESAGSDPAEGLSDADADARLGLAVAAHDQEVLSRIPRDGGREPPGELVRLMELVSQA